MSVSGLTTESNLKILDDIGWNNNISGVELNLSCPNIIGKPQIGYDFDAMDELLRKCFEKSLYNYKKKLFGLKLPPYFDISHFESAAKINQ